MSEILITLLLEETTKYSEDELVLLLKNSDRTVFEYLYDHYSGALNGIIFKMVNDKELSEDILQEAFLKIWNNFSSYDASKGRLFTWMLNITRNLTIDTIRSKSYKKQLKTQNNENAIVFTSNNINENERFDSLGIRKQTAFLKKDQKEVIDLAYFEGWTQEEISQKLNIPLGTVKTRMRTAISVLRKLLESQIE
ncbi:MAG: sigma-70 family RNA polymerase sigma factor [Ginsengibacter sp.]